LGGSYAYKLSRALSCGAQVKSLLSRLDEAQSWGLALDAGVQYFMNNDQLVLSGALRELGVMAPYQSVSDPLPMSGVFGVGYFFWPDEPWRFSLAAEGQLPLAGMPSLALGVEGWAENFLAVRAGVKSSQDAGDWLTLGAGIRWQGLHVDYALTPVGEMGWVHRVSLAYDFGSQRRLARPKLTVVMTVQEFVYPDGEPGYNIQLVPTAAVAAGLDRWDAVILETATRRIVYRSSGEKQLPLVLTWKGVDEAGTRVNVEGYYTFQVRVVDQQGYVAKAEGEILPISITALPKLKAMPRDIFAGQVTFRPRAGEDLREWSIEIVDSDGRVLKRYLGQGAIPKDFAWDGTDDKKRLVAVKTGYHFRLRTKDRQDNEMKSTAPLIVIDAGTKAYTDQAAALPEQVPFHFERRILRSNAGFSIVDIGTEKTSALSRVRRFCRKLWCGIQKTNKVAMSPRGKIQYVLQMQDSLGNVCSKPLPSGPLRSCDFRVRPYASSGGDLLILTGRNSNWLFSKN
jgi:hypothetical protein